jgi:hypothetical protein
MYCIFNSQNIRNMIISKIVLARIMRIITSGRTVSIGFTIRRGWKRYWSYTSRLLPHLLPSLSLLGTSSIGSDTELSLSLLHESVAFDMIVVLELTSLRQILTKSRKLSRSFGNFRKSCLRNDNQNRTFRHLYLSKNIYFMFGTII